MNRAMLSMVSVAVLSVAGSAPSHGAQPGSAPHPVTAISASAPASAQETRNAKVRAAAEPFEVLTEIGATAPTAMLDKAIADTEAARKTVHGLLSPKAASALDSRAAEIAAARKAMDRTGLQLAAVEGYRALVEDVTGASKIPVAVNLLDYAGFRYDVDLKAKPERWSDMANAAAFARRQWDSVSSRVTTPALRASVDMSIHDMETAARGRDAKLAGSAATTELALVDELEMHFSAK